MNLKDYFTEKAEEINKRIRQYLAVWNFPKPLNQAIYHILESGGKRFRPILTLLSCEAVGGEIETVFRPALSIELIHNASLLWDDVIDADDLRRGKITVHKKWDKNVALLAGGMLASKAFELITDKPNLLELYTKAIGKMIEGQVLDISNSLNTSNQVFESKSEKEIFNILRTRFRQKALEGMEWKESSDLLLITDFTAFEEERDYFEMIACKTTALIKLAARIGATLGGGSQKEIDALTKYGLYLGLAFQVRDDLLGIISNAKILGKPIGSDLREGKLNLYTIFALRNLENNELSEFLRLIRESDAPNTIPKIRKILDNCGALEYSEEKLKFLAMNARKQLSTLHETNAKNILNEIISFTIERDF